MSAPRYARLAGKMLLREEDRPQAPPSPEVRAAAIEAIARTLTAQARTRRRVQWASMMAAASLVLVVGIGASQHAWRRSSPPPVSVAAVPAVQIVAHPQGDGASVVVSGSPAPLADGRQVLEGSRLVTPANGRATLAFSTGTSITLGEATDLTVNETGPMQLLRLAGGWVQLHVAKLGPGERFVVGTPDTEVEVRGTQFRVSIVPADASCGGGTPTRVTVTEGVVAVRRGGTEVRVAAGERWPADCEGAELASNAPPHPSSGHGGRTAGTRASGRPGESTSTLADENDLFEDAMTAKNQGDAPAALASFEHLLARYPTGLLAESAEIQRVKLLRVVAPARAAEAARQYLAKYPEGLARHEAEAIVAGSP